jgi:tRNA nucleotidyltransferase (CCA-adding enzyme)
MDKQDFIIPELVLKVITVLQKAGYEAYIVGGAIHDLILKKPVSDWDFTTNAKPEQIQKLFPESFYDNSFGTVGITGEELAKQFKIKKYDWVKEQVSPDFVFDITTFRSESAYTDRRRPDKVVWGKTLQDDLKRRDFTINAMALNINYKPKVKSYKLEIIDPYNGQKDLKNKTIRAVGNPELRFNEDALRMMRAIRIAAQLGFIIEKNTLSAIIKNAGLLKHVSYERISVEFLKVLSSKYPAEGIRLFYSSGLLNQFLPELEKTRGIEQSGHHTKDVWNHSLDSLAACPSPDPIVRLATLLHDIAKPLVRKTKVKGEYTFYNHEVVGARVAKQIARRLRFSKNQVDKLWLLVRYHMFAYQPEMTDKAIRRFIRRVGRDNLNDMMMLRIGDRIGGGSKATSWRLRELQKRVGENLYTPMQVTDLKINGNDVIKLLGIKPGPKVGEILNQLFEEVLDDPTKNTKKYLLERIKAPKNSK